MTTTDIATRVYNHTFKLDPIIRSLLDTDVYKLLMLQTIWKEFAHVPVTFSLINRSPAVRLAQTIDEAELREQLDHARTVRLAKKERIWLAGNTFYGKERLFSPEFLVWLSEYRLPEYDLRVEDGQFRIDFSGPWAETTLWRFRCSPSSASCARAPPSGASGDSSSTSCTPVRKPGYGRRSCG